jgi:hypothetical protein
MPWTARDAYRHTKKASTPSLQRQWSHVANSALQGGDPDEVAIRKANSVVEGRSKPQKQKRRSA